MLRMHVIGLPHTISNIDFNSCAYTMKIIRFCKMMKDINPNNIIYYYGNEGSEIVCDEKIDVMSESMFEREYGKFESRDQIRICNPETKYVRTFNLAVAAEIIKRCSTNDIICFFYGDINKPVADNLSGEDVFLVEPSIAYGGNFAPYKVFESYSQQSFQSGVWNTNFNIWYESNSDEYGNLIDGVIPPYNCIADTDWHWYNEVIGAFLDPDQFDYNEKKEDYFLYVGRIIPSKGIQWMVDATAATDTKLKIAGQGNFQQSFGKVPSHVELLGHANVDQRRKLMSNAKASFLLTHYTEPFGHVVIENGLSGTPMITSDWGSFPDIVRHGESGYRVRTFEKTLWAIKNIDKIKPENCRRWAMNFTMQKVAPSYQDYFENLIRYKNQDSNSYYRFDERKNLDTLVRQNPS